MTLRIHPDDVPIDPQARRVIRHALAGPVAVTRPWLAISGIWTGAVVLDHADVRDWLVQDAIPPVVAPTCPHCGRSTADDDHIKIFTGESKLPHRTVCPRQIKEQR